MVENTITGRAKKHDGTAIDYVSIFNWADGKCIAQVVPDASGNWQYNYGIDLEVGLTYVADGCEPITHGPYNLISTWTPLTLQPKLYMDTNSAIWSGGVGSSIIAWEDLSGNNTPFLPKGSITKTASGGLSFNVGDNSLTNNTDKARRLLSGIGKAWVFLVIKAQNNGAAFFHVVDHATTYNPRLIIQSVSGKLRKNSSRNIFTSNSLYFTSDVSSDEYHMVLLEHDWQSGRVAWYVDGQIDTFDNNQITDKGITNSAMSGTSIHIGRYASGSESLPQEQKMLLVMTDVSLTQPDIDRLFGYAAHKHGLTNKLPASHPYKTNAPT